MYKMKNNFIKKIISRDYYLSLSVLSIVVKNRIKLKKLGKYIDLNEINKSNDKYGVWQNTDNLNKFLGFRLTNIDLMQFLTSLIPKKIIYTEIGVSVLKNFFLMANFLNKSKLYAFDINKIYPPMKKYLKQTSENKNIVEYIFKNNKIIYFQGNVFSQRDLENFSNIFSKKTNFVYSDADHSKEGLLFEYEHFYKNMLDEEFILYFDDINSKTMPGFKAIFEQIKKERTDKEISGYTFWINGWMGKNENQHQNGIISTINISKALKEKRIKLKYFKIL